MQSRISFRAAVAAIFNFDSFSSFISWKNKYYMQLAKNWVDSPGGQITKEFLVKLLVQAIKEMGITVTLPSV